MKIGEAEVEIRPDTKGFAGETQRGILGPIKGVALAAGGLLAVVGIGKFAASAIAAAQESNKVSAQTAAVIKSTGGAAKISANEVGALATAISNKTGVDDEAIQSGQNLLLTFTGVRNEVGQGNDIFNQATQTITDMSVALGQDTKSSAIQLGKALNDPIRGVTALQRVGVSFTASQKEQIKTLVESGDTLGAQKMILAELNKEFGGSAAAAATPIDKLKVSLGNLQEIVGNALLPVVNKLSTWLVSVLPGAISGTIAAFQAIGSVVGPIVSGIIGWFKNLGSSTSQVGGTFSTVRTTISTVMNSIRSIVTSVLGFISDFWGRWGAVISATAGRAMSALLQVIRGILQVIAGVFKLVASLIKGDWSGAWEAIKSIARGAANIVVGLVRGAWNSLRAIFGAVGAALKAAASATWNAIVALIRNAVNAVRSVVTTQLNAMKSVATAAWNAIRSAASSAWNAIRSLISSALSSIRSAITSGFNAARSAVVSAFNSMRSAAASGIGAIVSLVGSIPGRVRSAVGNLGGILVAAGRALITGLISGITSALGALYAQVSGIAGKIASLKGPIQKDRKLLIPAGQAIMGGLVRGIRDGQRDLAGALGNVTGQITGVGGGLAGAGAGGLNIYVDARGSSDPGSVEAAARRGAAAALESFRTSRTVRPRR